MTNRLRHSSRRGVSLVELIAVMFAGALLMGVTIAALIGAQRADRRFARRWDARAGVNELADQWRRDVHAASLAAWDADSDRLQLDLPNGGRVTYRQLAGKWERRFRRAGDDDDSLAGVFPLPRGVTAAVDVERTQKATLVTLKWKPTGESHDSTRTKRAPAAIVSAVGRDLELLYE